MITTKQSEARNGFVPLTSCSSERSFVIITMSAHKRACMLWLHCLHLQFQTGWAGQRTHKLQLVAESTDSWEDYKTCEECRRCRNKPRTTVVSFPRISWTLNASTRVIGWWAILKLHMLDVFMAAIEAAIELTYLTHLVTTTVNKEVTIRHRPLCSSHFCVSHHPPSLSNHTSLRKGD